MEEDHCERMALIGKALSDPCRVRILLNFGGRSLTISAITEELETYQSNVSYHIAILSKAGLVKRVDEGRWHNYAVDESALEYLNDFMSLCCRPRRRRQTVFNEF
ncbi:MAG: metalloregulator ArsR/SmtB family transcription factor [Thermoplasmata archaeon]|nr:metalloregulator ArsR/SmtB family transcription factor [Thermoplasmata archaeon]